MLISLLLSSLLERTSFHFVIVYINFLQRTDLHSYQTRSRFMLQINKTRTKLAETSIRYTLPKLVNDTTSVILEKIFSHSLQGFISYIKQYYISLYSFNCNIDNCYI